MSNERVARNLNRALHALFAGDERVVLIGEDLLDPYGGAFKIAQGLSSAFPDRVITTPISEETILGLASGLALFGNRPIVEIMFGDFIALGFDQILNVASKFVTMFGQRLEMNLVVRCPVGGNRGYGPTHSQSLQKHFIGIPNLDLFEVSPFHDNVPLLARLATLGRPCVLFEDKVLYTQDTCRDGRVDDLFSFELCGLHHEVARIFSKSFRRPTYTLIAPGGVALRCVAAARELFLEHEIECQVLVPSQLYPVPVDALLESLTATDYVFTVEEGVAGGAWGNEVAQRLYEHLWGRLKHRVEVLCSKESVIPTAGHLERETLIQQADICAAVRRAAGV